MSTIVVTIPGAKLLSTRGSGANGRQHWAAKGRTSSNQRSGANAAVARAIAQSCDGYRVEVLRWIDPTNALKGPSAFVAKIQVAGRVSHGYTIYPARRVTFTRICPKRYFCDPGGNLATLFKATEDGVADALGVNDKNFVPVAPGQSAPDGKVGVWYEQVDGPWGIRITIEA